ncbi:helix-loop-helix DNA-binding domain-containing protein [Glomus cerebriforme]|uniref:Helix-loop-helix DNA-binding domain-containing protein n=1 Tax=Glomus cerebriforme TaxID=658196 RepID=A0A397T1W6_9GLOM|nr:helix-loop-helix DNA-binding domain-containing protein [Glomus cerebriforme]
MNPQSIELYQGTSFVQPSQQQQQTTPQPIRLAHPTPYHLAQTQLRKNQKQFSSDGAPPTPNNSFQANNTLSNNSFSSNTIDPQILSMKRQLQQQYNINPIKQESTSSEIDVSMDYDNQTVLSPLTNSSGGSPPNNFETEEFGTSFKPTSHLGSLSSFGGSPGNNSLYSPSLDNMDYPFIEEELPMSAPTTTSAIGPMDVKNNMNNNTKILRHPHNNYNNLGHLSMSLPVLTNTGSTEWFGTSLESNFQPGTHPSSLQFPSNEMIPPGFMDSDDTDTQKQAMLFEKRRRRRESHNAVERRRRDNINEKIQELSTLLPDLYVDSANKPNKGVILRKSVDYIRHLKSMVEQERNRNVKLETQVRELATQSGIPIDNNSGSASSRSDLNNSSGVGLFGSSSLGSLP